MRRELNSVASRRLSLALAVFLAVPALHGAEAAPLPVSFGGSLQPLAAVEKILMPPVDNAAALAAEAARAAPGIPPRFAVPAPVSVTAETAGTWERAEGGSWVWRLRIHSPGALSLNFGFTGYRMPDGGMLFLYGADGTSVRGPFTAGDVESHGQLWTPLVEGDEAVIEVSLPASARGGLHLELSSVNHGFRDLSGGVDKSGACNIDVVCPEGDPWQDEIRSVAVYTLQGFWTCTGTLMNNTAGDLRPFFLTADHCGVDAATAPTLVAYWNFETSICGGAPDGQLDQFQTGAAFRAGWPSSDFTLAEFDDMPSPEFNVHWAGWDNSGDPVPSATAIHHPSTDEKRISFENDPLSVTSYLADAVPGNGTHWKVTDWDLGTTEPGSSGSGLWDQNHRLIGQLHGGYAACGNNDADWYGRFSVSWEGGGTADTRLRDWLDPLGSGGTVLDGLDACPSPSVDFSIDPNPAIIGDTISFTSSVSGGTAPYTYEWDFDGDMVIDSTDASPTHVYGTSYVGNVRLLVWDSTLCPGISSRSIVVTTDPADEIFPPGAAMPPGWTQAPGSQASWDVAADEADEGSFSLKSGLVFDDETAAIEVTDGFTDGFVSYSRKVSSEATYDFFRFYIDGALREEVSGESDWTAVSFPVTAGIHTLRWAYDKDYSVSEGGDAAWIDLVDFPVDCSVPRFDPAAGTLAISAVQINGTAKTYTALLTQLAGGGYAFELTSASRASGACSLAVYYPATGTLAIPLLEVAGSPRSFTVELTRRPGVFVFDLTSVGKI